MSSMTFTEKDVRSLLPCYPPHAVHWLMTVATCSADQKIKIFRKNLDNVWEPETEWKVGTTRSAVLCHFSTCLLGYTSSRSCVTVN